MKQEKELMHELGRYRKMVETRQKQINQLQQELAAARMSNDMSEAFVALILEKCGADRGGPVRITTKEVAEAVQNRRRAVMQVVKGDEVVISMWSDMK